MDARDNTTMKHKATFSSCKATIDKCKHNPGTCKRALQPGNAHTRLLNVGLIYFKRTNAGRKCVVRPY